MKRSVISSDKITLVPYQEFHVLQYHEWMQNPSLLEATASEPLTLEEEYLMQESWANDGFKYCFIIHQNNFQNSMPPLDISNHGQMIGDVNLFLTQESTAEINVMIAHHNMRKKGYGFEAVSLTMTFAKLYLNLKKLFTKIHHKNTASLGLFQNKLGFKQVSYSEYFQEYTLEMDLDNVVPLQLNIKEF